MVWLFFRISWTIVSTKVDIKYRAEGLDNQGNLIVPRVSISESTEELPVLRFHSQPSDSQSLYWHAMVGLQSRSLNQNFISAQWCFDSKCLDCPNLYPRWWTLEDHMHRRQIFEIDLFE
jgi:hypothetical protein